MQKKVKCGSSTSEQNSENSKQQEDERTKENARLRRLSTPIPLERTQKEETYLDEKQAI